MIAQEGESTVRLSNKGNGVQHPPRTKQTLVDQWNRLSKERELRVKGMIQEQLRGSNGSLRGRAGARVNGCLAGAENVCQSGLASFLFLLPKSTILTQRWTQPHPAHTHLLCLPPPSKGLSGGCCIRVSV